jgi:GxxExxY protein
VEYDGVQLGEGFRADLLIERVLIVEVKSVERLSTLHTKQLLTYLRLLQQPLGLLMNFGGATFREGIRRVVNDYRVASPHLRINQVPTIPFE